MTFKIKKNVNNLFVVAQCKCVKALILTQINLLERVLYNYKVMNKN